MSKPKLVAMGAGAKQLSMIALDLDNAEKALALAKLFAERTGRTITVRDALGAVLHIVQAPALN